MHKLICKLLQAVMYKPVNRNPAERGEPREHEINRYES